jgi:hypothetical protein
MINPTVLKKLFLYLKINLLKEEEEKNFKKSKKNSHSPLSDKIKIDSNLDWKEKKNTLIREKGTECFLPHKELEKLKSNKKKSNLIIPKPCKKD